MASSREMTASARPLTTHRPSLSNASSTGLPGRQSHNRTSSHSSHSLLTSSLNPNHRVTRRKSVNGHNANMAAVTAALRDGDKTAAMPISNASGRRNTVSKTSGARGGLVGSLPSPPSSLPSKGMVDVKREMGGSAIEDPDSADDASASGSGKVQNARIRRASDGQPLTKEGKKSNRVELKCEKCGKGYKHSSCLTKHLWEHTPEWSLTSKLLISKHQQVQLLEAASVLVAMNDKPEDSATTPPDSAKDFASDPESASPAASGYSDQVERQSSADTTPPPIYEGLQMNGTSYRNKRTSSIGGFSRSYQSAPGLAPGSLPANSFGHSRQPSDPRPTSSGANNTGQDDRDLAAAVELLSCSFGSNNGNGINGTVMIADAPPVPPVPAQYLDQANSLGNTGFINSFPRRQPESFTRGDIRRGSDSEDVKMSDTADSGIDEDDFDMQPRARSEEEDDGVFGSMEE